MRIRSSGFYLGVMCAVLCNPVLAAAQHNVLAKIALPTDHTLIAVNSTTNRIYAAGYHYDEGDWAVFEIDGATSAVIATMVMGTEPRAVFMDTSSNRLLVAGFGGDEGSGVRLTSIDGATGEIVHTPLSFMEPAALTVNPATGEIVVVGYDGEHLVTVIDGASGAILHEGPLFHDASALAVNVASNQIYMASRGGNIAVFDLATREIVNYIFPEMLINNLAFDAAQNVLYVEGRDFTQLDGAGLSASVVATIDVNSQAVLSRTHTGISQSASAFNIATRQTYVVGVDDAQWPDPEGLPWMAIVDPANPGTFTRLPMEFRATAMAADPVTSRIYVGGSSAYGWFWGIAVLDGAAAIPSSPPTPPTNVSLPPSPTNVHSVQVAWDAAADDVGIVKYDIVRNEIVVGTVGGDVTSFLDVDTPEENYDYWIRAFDTDGLISISHRAPILVDRTPPTFSTPFISPPQNQVLVATSSSGATATWTVLTFEAHSWPATVSCSHQSGSDFPIGVTLVTCTATDRAGNSASTSFTITVKATSSLSAPAVTGTYGETVILRATLVHSGTVPVAGKTLAFHVNGDQVGTAVTSSTGEAVLALTAAFNAGSHAVQAEFSGDAAITASSASTSLVIAPRPLSIGATNANKVFGEAVPALGATATGLVNGDTVASLNGTLALATTATATSLPGSYPITVGGVSSPNYVIAFVPGTLTIVKASAAVAVSTSPEPSAFDGPMTFTAVVNAVAPGAGMPTGALSFFDGSVLLGTAPLSNGVATLGTAGLAPGLHTIEARYHGDTAFQIGVGTSSHRILSAELTPSITLSSSNEAPKDGTPVTFTVAVSASGTTPTGSVTFYNGTAQLGAATLLNGAATLTISTLPVGSHAIYARYLGAAGLPAVTSAVMVQTIKSPGGNPKGSSITLTSSSNPSVIGSAIEFHVTVSGSAAAPTGRVLFMIDDVVVGDPEGEPLRGVDATTSTAGLDVPVLAGGTHRVSATYLGDATYRGSTAAISQGVR